LLLTTSCYDQSYEIIYDFDPYSTMSAVKAIKKVLYSQDASNEQETLRQRGEVISSRYLPAAILTQWETFLEKVSES
jgi:hypothetical protein